MTEKQVLNPKPLHAPQRENLAIIILCIFFLIAAPAESWDKDESGKGNESYIEALLQKQKDNQGWLQTYFTKVCA